MSRGAMARRLAMPRAVEKTPLAAVFGQFDQAIAAYEVGVETIAPR